MFVRLTDSPTIPRQNIIYEGKTVSCLSPSHMHPAQCLAHHITLINTYRMDE